MSLGEEVARPLRGAGDDLVLPFQIEAADLRGRLVRLGPAVDRIIGRHDYPEPVARLLAETLATAVALAGALKYDGVFTLQTKGDGPVRLMVADVTSDGTIRAYAQFDADRLAMLGAAPGLRGLLGQGYLAFTVDQGENTERYQGIVELKGGTLAECVQHYFTQSEQIATGIKTAVGRGPGGWRSGAILVQRLPEGADPLRRPAGDADEDGWRRVMVLIGTCTEAEMVDPDLTADRLLYRLFHEEEVLVYPPHALHDGCRCSRERVGRVLGSLPAEDRAELRQDGTIMVTCEFCSTVYRFDEAELEDPAF